MVSIGGGVAQDDWNDFGLRQSVLQIGWNWLTLKLTISSFDFTRTSTGNPATILALMSEYSLGMPPGSSAMQEGQAATCVSSGMNRNMTSLSHFVDHHFSSTYFTSAANSNSNALGKGVV